jgi:hypothetical protein
MLSRTQGLGGAQLSMATRSGALHTLDSLAAVTMEEHATEDSCLESLRYLAHTIQDNIHDADAAMSEDFDRARLLR